MEDIMIPKEIRNFQVKTFGPFTTRQAICFITAAIPAVGVYALEKAITGMAAPPFIPPVLVSIPGIFMGWGESFLHMKPEDYIRYIWIPNKKRPKSRKYVSNNYLNKVHKATVKSYTATVEKPDKKKKNKTEGKVVIPEELKDALTMLPK